jgi:hypothetical protein
MEQQSKLQERRGSTRMTCKIPVEYNRGDGKWHSTVSDNISLKGVMFFTFVQVMEDETLRLRLHLGRTKKSTIEVTAKVVWAQHVKNERLSSVGVQFENPEISALSVLEQFLLNKLKD